MDTIELLRQARLEVAALKDLLWQQNFLTARWWTVVIVIAVSYAVWWVLVDKRRLPELLLYGSFIAVARIIFDDWGILNGRWTYIIDLFRKPPISLFLNDLTVVPLAFMLVYQYAKSWVTFLALTVGVEGIIAFVFLPFLARMGILVIHNWSYFGSFLFMVVTAIIMRVIMHIVLEITHNYQAAGARKAGPLRPVFGRNAAGGKNKNKV